MEPHDLHEILGRVKLIVGPTTPITVPQIWVDGDYGDSADQLQSIVDLQAKSGDNAI